MNYRLARLHEGAIEEALGPSGRMISSSKGTYRDEHPDHLLIFNANVCLGSGKVWWGDLDLTIDEPALLDLASSTGEIVSVLYETDGRLRYEDHPLVAEAVYSAAPSGHSLVDSALAERRADGRLCLRAYPRPSRWRRPGRPRLWRFWEVSASCERSSDPNEAQTSRFLRVGRQGAVEHTPLLVLGVHTWSRGARGAWVEWTWHPGSHRAWAPHLSGLAKWRRGQVRPYVSARLAPGVAHEFRAGFIAGPGDAL